MASMAERSTFCPARRRRFVLVASILASAMAFIDGSVVAIAVPAIRADLDATLVEIQWINNAYLLALSALILAGGAAGDAFGLRRVFLGGIGVFTLASILCAAAPDPVFLTFARVVQGIGAAFMVPLSLALISKAYPREERGKAIGIWAAASALTTAAGPILGGALLGLGPDWAWRLVFAINLPVGIVAFAMLWLLVPPDEPGGESHPDWAGAVLATIALGLLAWALTGPGGEHGGGPSAMHTLGWGAASLVVLGLFLWRQTRAEHPMMPLHLFTRPGFSAANISTFLLYAALGAVLFFLPMTLIAGHDVPEAQAGLIFIPLTAFVALLSGPVGGLVERFGAGLLIGAGSILVAIAFGILGLFLGPFGFWGGAFPAMVVMGLGMGIVVAPLSAAVMGAVEDDDSGAASGINNTVSRIAGLVAVAALGGLVGAAFDAAGGVSLPTGFGEAPQDASEAALRTAHDAGFAVVAWTACALAAASAAIAFLRLPVGRQPSP
ncbi:MAG: MFS transporter [Rubricella sp.]